MPTMNLTDIVITLCLLCAFVVYGITLWLRKRLRKQQVVSWPMTLRFHHLKIKGDITMFQLLPGTELPFVLGKPIKADGTPGEIEDGSLKILSTDESVFVIAKDAKAADPDDPFTGVIRYVGPGEAKFHAEGDADLGDGVDTIVLEVDGTCLEAEATGFAPIAFGAARPIEQEESASASTNVGE